MRVFFEFEQLPTQSGKSNNRVTVTSRNAVIREFIHDFTAEGWLVNPRPPIPQPGGPPWTDPVGAPWTDMSCALMDNGFVLNLDAHGWPWPRANKRFSLVIDAQSCPDPEFSIDVYQANFTDWHFAVSAIGTVQFNRYEYHWQWLGQVPPTNNQSRIVQLEMQSNTIIVR